MFFPDHRRINGPLDQWFFGPMSHRTNSVSERWVIGPMGHRTNQPSDHRAAPPTVGGRAFKIIRRNKRLYNVAFQRIISRGGVGGRAWQLLYARARPASKRRR